STIQHIKQTKTLLLSGAIPITFDPLIGISFLVNESLPYHPNALTFLCTLANGDNIADTYYSIGGGFVEKDDGNKSNSGNVELHFPIDDAKDLLHWCLKTGLSISEIVAENEAAWRPEADTQAGLI